LTTAVLTETALPVLTMEGGLAGFPDADRYALVELPEASPLFLLRSLDVEGLEFVVAPPAVFFAEYAPELDDATVDMLGITDAADVLLLVMLTIGTGIETATANLLAPIVINQRTRTAAQVVLQADWPLRAPLRP
jgi:flagellar assembly factor FliW